MRTLAIASLSCAAAVFAAVYWLPLSWLPVLAVASTLYGAALFARRQLWLRFFALIFCALGFGFCLCWVHSQFTVVPAASLAGLETEIRAQLVDYPEVNERYTRAEVRLAAEGLPRLKALLYDNSGALAEAEPGDWVVTQARLRPADTLYGERYLGYQSRGFWLIASAKGEILVTKGSALRFWAVRLNHTLCAMIETVFPSDAAVFLRALMLGDKSELYQNDPLHLALSRAGLMHVVAVSGMHVAFFAGLLQTVFGRGRRATLLCLAVSWLYVFVTGAAPSAVRAGVMLTLLLLAPLFYRENDPLTSISAALGLLLLVNPRAVANVGLQFSFASMAGILSFSERLSEAAFERFPALRETRLRRAAVGTAVNSLSVMPFTLPLMAVHYGEVPLLALLSNLFTFPAIVLCFYGGYLCCALGFLFLPLGHAAGWLLAWAVRYVVLIARAISRLSFSTVYLNHPLLVVWLFVSYALFLGFALLRRRAVIRFGLPALLSALTLCGILLGIRMGVDSRAATFAALDVGQGQCLALLSGPDTLLIDCGGGGTTDDAGETAAAWLLTRGRTRVDVLVLTHLDEDHSNGAALLMELCPVRLLLTREEPGEALRKAANACGAEIQVLNEDTALTLGDITARLYMPPAGAKGNDRSLAAWISVGDYDMLVTGDLSSKGEKALLASHSLPEMELFVAGHHGSKTSSCDDLLAAIRPQIVLVSSGYNTYGHPAPETLSRLAGAGCTIYRTDENGSIEVRLRR